MYIDDELTEVVVCFLITLITNDEEQIETRHDGSWELDIVF